MVHDLKEEVCNFPNRKTLCIHLAAKLHINTSYEVFGHFWMIVVLKQDQKKHLRDSKNKLYPIIDIQSSCGYFHWFSEKKTLLFLLSSHQFQYNQEI